VDAIPEITLFLFQMAMLASAINTCFGDGVIADWNETHMIIHAGSVGVKD
jgi:hypothetical protein